MRLKKLVPMVGFCAFSLLSSSAMAQLWALNCEKNQCLEAIREGGKEILKVSNCDPKQISQQWFLDASVQPSSIQNASNEFGKPCLDMIKLKDKSTRVVTNRCNPHYRAQRWNFAPNGSVDTIKNSWYKECLTVEEDGTVTPASCNDDPSQRWAWVNVGDNPPDCPTAPAAESDTDTGSAWTPVPKTALGDLPLNQVQVVTNYDLPTVIPSTAKEILVYAYLTTGYGNPDANLEVRIYTQEGSTEYSFYLFLRGYNQNAYSYNSQTFWLPITSLRKIFAESTGTAMSGGTISELSVIGYK